MASPHNLDAVRAAMDLGQAVVVILTAEDQGGRLPWLAGPDDEEDLLLQGQPRQNVVLEAGMAMGIDRNRTVLVEIGRIRRPSDFDGLNTVRLTNDVNTRSALRSRLRDAGCLVNDSGNDWLSPQSGGDFEACVIPWQPVRPPEPDPSS
jgi:predicted nucleotide-binding protein